MTDLATLEAFLCSEDSPDDCMLLSDLDGFLTGVVCSPGTIMPSEWLPIALGGRMADVPHDILDLVMQRYNEIVAGLNDELPVLEPIFWRAKERHVIAMDWCEGFMDALALRSEDWDTLMVTDKGREWMFPILAHLVDEKGQSLVGATEEQIDALIDAAAEKVPETVPHIFKFWQAGRASKRAN